MKKNGGENPRRTDSWLSGLFSEDPIVPGRKMGRLKGRTLRNLVVLGLAILLGVALMGLPKAVRTQPDRSQDTTVDALGSSPAGPGTASLPGSGSSTLTGSLGAGKGSSEVWAGVSGLEDMMERTLEHILSRIDGAGEVTVAVSLERGATYVYGYDQSDATETTEERDANGGSRVVTQSDTSRTAVIVSQDGASVPVFVGVDLPPIKGVVVVATGAGDSRVKALLSKAVETLYGVPAHRVAVMAGH